MPQAFIQLKKRKDNKTNKFQKYNMIKKLKKRRKSGKKKYHNTKSSHKIRSSSKIVPNRIFKNANRVVSKLNLKSLQIKPDGYSSNIFKILMLILDYFKNFGIMRILAVKNFILIQKNILFFSFT